MEQISKEKNNYSSLFDDKFSIIGMLHLAGNTETERVERALEEMKIYEEEGLSGVIVENYCCNPRDVFNFLEKVPSSKLKLGVNILPNGFCNAFFLTEEFPISFIQLDYVSGNYGSRGRLDMEYYQELRERHSNVVVLGGVWPKYYTPIEGSDLGRDLKVGARRADAIVVTGSATGQEVPDGKIIEFRKILGKDKPLIIGAGLTAENVGRKFLINHNEEQIFANGGIVGSYFKPNQIITSKVDRTLVRKFMNSVKNLESLFP